MAGSGPVFGKKIMVMQTSPRPPKGETKAHCVNQGIEGSNVTARTRNEQSFGEQQPKPTTKCRDEGAKRRNPLR